MNKIQNSLKSLWNRFVSEKDAALDQWISVLVLAILALIIFVALKGPITYMLNGAVTRVGAETNNLFDSQTIKTEDNAWQGGGTSTSSSGTR